MKHESITGIIKGIIKAMMCLSFPFACCDQQGFAAKILKNGQK
jgi:hypothetical protein